MQNPASVEQFKLSLESQRDRFSYDFNSKIHSYSDEESLSFQFAPTNSTANKVLRGLKKRRIELCGLKPQNYESRKENEQDESSSSQQEKHSIHSISQEDSKEQFDDQDDTDLMEAKLLKLQKIEEELSQKHTIQWTNYQIQRNQAKSYEVQFQQNQKKWSDIKDELCLLNYQCQFMKREIESLESQTYTSEIEYNSQVEKQKFQIKEKILNSSIKRGFQAFMSSHFLSEYEICLESGIDILQNYTIPKKKGLVVRYMRFDPLIESSSYVNEITRKERNSYFINFQINDQIVVFELFQECCRMWDLNKESAIMTDQYFNIVSKEALKYTAVSSLFNGNYHYLSEQKIMILYIFKNEERIHTHIKRLQSYLTEFEQQNQFKFFDEKYSQEQNNDKIKRIMKSNPGVTVYEEADENAFQKLKIHRKCGRGQFILSPFGLASIIVLVILMLGLIGHNHDSNYEYWLKKAIQQFHLNSSISGNEIHDSESFYNHQISKYESMNVSEKSSDFDIYKFQIRKINRKSGCLRSEICSGQNKANSNQNIEIEGPHEYELQYNPVLVYKSDQLHNIQNFQTNYYESIPGPNYISPLYDIPDLMDSYSVSQYINKDTHYIIIQTYFTDQSQSNYLGIGQQVYEVKTNRSVSLKSIDSSLFQPDLLQQSSSKPAYVFYCISLFCIILGSIFFITLKIIDICKIRRANNITNCSSKIVNKIKSIFFKFIITVLCCLHFADLSKLTESYSSTIDDIDRNYINLNFAYLAIYSFISMALLIVILMAFKYSRLCFKCYLNFRAVIEAIPCILMIYVLTVAFFIWYTLLVSESSTVENRTSYNLGMIFLSEFQNKNTSLLKFETRQEKELLLFILLYLFGIVILFTSMPFAFLLESKRKFSKFLISETPLSKLTLKTQFKSWLCNWKKSKKRKLQK